MLFFRKEYLLKGFCCALQDRSKATIIAFFVISIGYGKKRYVCFWGDRAGWDLGMISCCAYCSLAREHNALETLAACEGVTAFVPIKIKKEKRHGQWVVLKKHLLPGYIFLYGAAEDELFEAAGKARVRLLRYTDETWVLQGSDREFAQWIYDHNGTAELSKVIRCGDTIKVTEGPLADLQGVVTHVDLRRQLMKVKLGINDFHVWLSFDWAEPITEKIETL